ncbi:MULTISPECIES: PhoH family protein [unclassified Schlesneria]|uniref:PhoH family protein n=1 Tax=Schlesneria TaxID=656899 RepID=UPI00359FB88A
MSEGRVQFRNYEDVRTLFGLRDKNLRRLRDVLHLDVVLRGDELHLHGEQAQVDLGKEIVSELRSIIEQKGLLDDDEFDRALHRGQFPVSSNPDELIDVFHKARKIRPLGTGQRDYIRAIREHDLVICEGPAGSGKSYLAVAMAVNALRLEQVRKIVLVRPAVEAGEKLGFLPGDMLAKVNPYLRPLLDALGDILDFEQVQRYLDKEVIEIIPLAYMRGRTLNNTFMILDEAQNTTVTQMKMFLTRMGHHSKIVVTGDGTQTDLPDRVESGLNDAIRRLRNIPGIATVSLSGSDIVRHPLVRKIVQAYDVRRDGPPDGRWENSWHQAGETENVNPGTGDVEEVPLSELSSTSDTVSESGVTDASKPSALPNSDTD